MVQLNAITYESIVLKRAEDDYAWFRNFCQNLPFTAQNHLKLEAFSDIRHVYMCGLSAM